MCCGLCRGGEYSINSYRRRSGGGRNMIKINGLRIGNYIFDDDGSIAKVIGFKPYEHSVRCDEEEGCDILIDIHGADGKIRSGYAVESTSVSPIPLTHEWLQRCGWATLSDEYDDIKVWSKSLIEIALKDGKFHLHTSCTDPYYNQCIEEPIIFLHQLQNLYFALTGEEIQIKMS